MINFYTVMPAKLKKPIKIDKQTNMSIPYRMIICGASGSMKTNTLVNIIKLQASNFHRIIINTRNANEPLYNYLKLRIPESQLTINEGLESIPSVDDFSETGESVLVVFDDLVLENQKQQDEKISPYFIRGRKCGCSCIYLSQNYSKIPLNIRRNIGYVILKKISSNREITAILKNYSLECSKEKLIEMYENSTKNQTDFLMIDLDADSDNRFRLNFKKIIKPS
jgi:ribosomal silencing factor RsfS